MKQRIIAFLLLLSFLLGGCEYGILFETAPSRPVPSRPLAAEAAELTVHFMDVGQADCALLECDGKYMLIDGGNQDDGQLVVSYLETQGVEELVAVVCTHAHEDHVGGLAAVLAVYPTQAVYAPTKTYASRVFDNFLHYTGQQRLEVIIPEPGDSWELGGADVTVLGPVKSYAEPNDTSLILLVEFGDTRFLFTGDMETTAEGDMLDYWEGRLDWDVDVLKIGHHGSETSSSYRFIYETQPEYGVIPVERGNSYGHPHEHILRRYRDAGTTIFRTDRLGWIIARSDGLEVSFVWENQNREPENALPAGSIVYIGNMKSGKFHSSECGSLPKESNRIYFDSYMEAAEAGYTPCAGCLK